MVLRILWKELVRKFCFSVLMDLLIKIVGKVVVKECNNEVFVGVCGGIGVGKILFFNVFFGIDEFLFLG